MEFMDLAPLLGIPAVIKVLDAYRQLVTDHDLRKALYTVGAWAVGVGVVFLVTQSSADLPIGNWADVVLVGIGLGATASVVHDFATRGEYEIAVTDEIEFEVDETSLGYIEE